MMGRSHCMRMQLRAEQSSESASFQSPYIDEKTYRKSFDGPLTGMTLDSRNRLSQIDCLLVYQHKVSSALQHIIARHHALSQESGLEEGLSEIDYSSAAVSQAFHYASVCQLCCGL